MPYLGEIQEAKWVGQQRSRPLALLGRVRQLLSRELDTGDLPPTVHYVSAPNGRRWLCRPSVAVSTHTVGAVSTHTVRQEH